MKIKEIRQLRNISQDQLAKAIGVQSSAISKYETGRVDIPSKRLEQIADYLKVSINVLTTDDDIIVKSNGDVISLNEYVFGQAIENIPDSIHNELIDIFSSHDLDWQKKILKQLKVSEIVESKEYNALLKLLQNTLICMAITALLCQVGMAVLLVL